MPRETSSSSGALLLCSGTWLTITVCGGAVSLFEFIEGNTITRLFFLRLRRLTIVALDQG
jgi:hypothetical protein